MAFLTIAFNYLTEILLIWHKTSNKQQQDQGVKVFENTGGGKKIKIAW